MFYFVMFNKPFLNVFLLGAKQGDSISEKSKKRHIYETFWTGEIVNK